MLNNTEMLVFLSFLQMFCLLLLCLDTSCFKMETCQRVCSYMDKFKTTLSLVYAQTARAQINYTDKHLPVGMDCASADTFDVLSSAQWKWGKGGHCGWIF